MSEHFIKNIEIKNFKCFEDFKAEGFGRVNLIGGKNNVGKTAFMEVLFLTSQLKYDFQHFITALFTIEDNRNPIGEMDKNKFTNILQKFSPLNLSDNYNHSVDINIDGNGFKLNITSDEKEIKFDDINILAIFNKHISAFIPSHILDNRKMQVLYDGVKRNRKRDDLNKFIQSFDNDLIEIDVIDNIFKIFSKSRDNWISIFEYGEGIRHYIAHICAIWANEDGIIFIDEIENGIHYTNLDKLWELILTISKEQNVQVFATTHSKECIESFNRVQLKLKDKDTYYFEMARNIKTNQIFMTAIDSNQLEYELSHQGRFRGE